MVRLGFFYHTALTLACLILSASPRADDSEGSLTLANKIFLRASGGIISNVGTSSGSTITFGGANIGGVYFFTPILGVGIAYKAETTFGAVPLKGFDIFCRYYYFGPGTVVTSRDVFGNKFTHQSPLSAYAGMEFSNRDFNFELDPTAALAENRAVSGTISAANLMAGLDYRLNRHWEANAELSYTLFPFGGNDPRVKIQWILVSLGGSYVF